MAGSIARAEVGVETVHVWIYPCTVCGTQHEFILDYDRYKRWQNGAKIQDVWPEMSIADREILISGTCDECFNELFPPEDN